MTLHSKSKRKKAKGKTAPSTPSKEFSTEKIMKIWFSNPEKSPLGEKLKGKELPLGGELNEYRLEQHRTQFPQDSITVLSNHTDKNFPEKDRMRIEEFCKENGIFLMSLDDVQKELEDSSLEDKELQLDLLRIARLEITDEYGCHAAASDIVRVLSPILGKIYSDFDIKKKKSGKTMVAEHGFLVHIKEPSSSRKGKYREDITNSILFCDESISSFAQDYRAEMHKRYYDMKFVFSLFEASPALREHIIRTIAHKDFAYKGQPFALLFRRLIRDYLKDEWSEETHEQVTKAFVLECTGPACMKDVLLSRTFPKLFKKFNPHNISQELINSISICAQQYQIYDEEDLSWLPSEDSRTERLLRMQDPADTLFQPAYRNFKLREEERLKVREEERLQGLVESPPSLPSSNIRQGSPG